MGKKSVEFEQLIERLYRLKAGDSARVQHDGEIVDPDAPGGDLRQIDVLLIASDGKRTAIECRDRSGAQSVMWVEELIGRKLSLGLDGMIGVSVKGFSKLARTKAARYGIQVYDLPRLTDAEVSSWGELVTVEASFVVFSGLAIGVDVGQANAQKLTQNPLLAYKGADGLAHIMDLLRDDAVANPGQVLSKVISEAGFTVDDFHLVGPIVASFRGHLQKLTAKCTSAQAFGDPGVHVFLRSASVQRFDHTVQEALLVGEEASLRVDVSSIQAPDNAILHELKVMFPRTVTLKQYELVGSRRMASQVTKVALLVHAS